MLKKIFSILLSLIIIVTLVLFSTFSIINKFFSNENINNVIDKLVVELNDEIYKDTSISFTEMIINAFGNNDPLLKEYFNEEEIKKEYSKLFIQYVLYLNGFPNASQPDFYYIENLINNKISAYEKATGNQIDRTYINLFFDEFSKNIQVNIEIPSEYIEIIKLLSSSFIKNILLTIIIICFLLLLLINKKILSVLKYTSFIFLVNTILLSIFTNSFKPILNDTLAQSGISNFSFIIDNIFSKFNSHIAITSIIFVVSFIIIVITKIIKNNKVAN